MIVDFLKQWGILHWQIAQTPYHHVTLLPGTPSTCHSIVRTSYQLVTLFRQIPYCLDTLSHSSYLTQTLSHSHPISLTLSHSHPISLTLSHPHPISLSPYLRVTLSPVCPGGDGGDAGAGAIPHRDGHGAGAAPRPEGQPAGASERAQTHPRCGNSLACMHVSSRFVTLVFLSFS